MCKCMETGNSWHLGLLEYLCTPISDHVPSPSELLNCRYRGVQPFLHFNAKASTASFLPQEKVQEEQERHQISNEFHYNKSSVAQWKSINEGSNVLVHITDQKPKRWEKGIVLHCNNKTYDIKLENDKILNCNRVDVRLSKLPSIPKPSLPLPELKPAKSNALRVTQHIAWCPPPPPPPVKAKPLTGNTSKDSTIMTTRSGRTVRPVVKMDF